MLKLNIEIVENMHRNLTLICIEPCLTSPYTLKHLKGEKSLKLFSELSVNHRFRLDVNFPAELGIPSFSFRRAVVSKTMYKHQYNSTHSVLLSARSSLKHFKQISLYTSYSNHIFKLNAMP